MINIQNMVLMVSLIIGVIGMLAVLEPIVLSNLMIVTIKLIDIAVIIIIISKRMMMWIIILIINQKWRNQKV